MNDVGDWPEVDRYWVGVCTSEITTNAVRHSQSGCVLNGTAWHFGVRAIRDDPLVRVEVADYGRAAATSTPVFADGMDNACGEEIRVGGLGLSIVEELCEEWGFRATKLSRMTWFTYRRQDTNA